MQVEYDDNVWVAAGDGDMERTLRHLGNQNPDMADEYGYTPLMAACSYGHVDLVKKLLELGSDPNKRDNDGNTAIHHCDFSSCLLLLLANGGNVMLKNADGETALQVKQTELEEGVVVEDGREMEEEQLDGELSRLVALLIERNVEEEVAVSKRVKGSEMDLEEL